MTKTFEMQTADCGRCVSLFDSNGAIHLRVESRYGDPKCTALLSPDELNTFRLGVLGATDWIDKPEDLPEWEGERLVCFVSPAVGNSFRWFRVMDREAVSNEQWAYCRIIPLPDPGAPKEKDVSEKTKVGESSSTVNTVNGSTLRRFDVVCDLTRGPSGALALTMTSKDSKRFVPSVDQARTMIRRLKEFVGDDCEPSATSHWITSPEELEKVKWEGTKLFWVCRKGASQYSAYCSYQTSRDKLATGAWQGVALASPPPWPEPAAPEWAKKAAEEVFALGNFRVADLRPQAEEIAAIIAKHAPKEKV